MRDYLKLSQIAIKDRKAFAMGPFGSNIKAENYVDEGIPVIRGINIKEDKFDLSELVFLTEEKAEELKNSQAFPNDIVFVAQGNVGTVSLVPENTSYKKFVLSQNLMKVTIDSIMANPRFVYYYFTSVFGKYEIKKYVNTTGVPCISQPLSSLKLFEVPAIGLTIQDEIVSILSPLDTKIDLLRCQNETLEKIAQALFKRWFVEFEFPNEEGKPYKSFGGKMVPSELGDVPVGWFACDIGNEIKILGGGTPSTKEPMYWYNGDINWYTPSDLTRSKILFSLGSERKITNEGLVNCAASMFPAYSLMMTSRATVGEIAINTIEACTNQGFIILVPNKNYSLYFLHGWLLMQLSEIKRLASGSTFPEMSRSEFKKFPVLRVSQRIMNRYEIKIKPFYRKIENNIRESLSLTKCRDVLFPKLMSGQIRVR